MSTNIIPISDLRRRPSQVIQIIKEGSGIAYITQHGRPTAVLIDFDEYEAMQKQLVDLQTHKRIAENGPSYNVNALHALAEMAEDLGVDDLAENHDYYLYGVSKE